MKIEAIHVGMRVKHPNYGLGKVKSVSEQAVEVQFDDGVRTVDPVAGGIAAAEPAAAISGLEMPLAQLVAQTVERVLHQMGWERPDATVEELGARWHRGRVLLHPADPALQPKELPIETLFHKIVGVRNQLRVLEQKINSHPGLSDAEKIEMQQYITRCYGSLTTFNLLFKRKEDYF